MTLPNDQLTASEKLFGLGLLWKEAAYNFAFFDQVPHLDWDRAYQQYIPLVLGTDSTFSYYRVLQRFCALLQDGHSYVQFPQDVHPEAVVDGPGIKLRAVEQQAVVENVTADLHPVLPVGAVITHVDGLTTAEHIGRHVVPFITASTPQDRWRRAIEGSPRLGLGLLYGPTGSQATLRVQTSGGEEHTVLVTRDHHRRQTPWTIHTPSLPVTSYRVLASGVSYVALNTFNDPAVVSDYLAYLPGLRAARGLIIDLRCNGGGNGAFALEIAQTLRDSPFTGSAWSTREHVAAFKAWGVWGRQAPEYASYLPYVDGTAWRTEPAQQQEPAAHPVILPTAVLTGSATFSAAEDFLVFLDGATNMVRVGEATGGSTGQPLKVGLPGGGQAGICTKRDRFADGREFVGLGIQPHLEVHDTVTSVRAGRDVVLERAQAYLEEVIGRH